MGRGLIKVFEELVKSVMSDDPVHGYPHVLRVRDLALWIASKYKGVDVESLEIAALLHDIARSNSIKSSDHALKSAKVAELLLKAMGYPEDRIKLVVEAIATHSYSGGREPKSLEAKILSDADKLDALGAIGVARVLMYSAYVGRGLEGSIEHFRSKILKLPDLMKTSVGKEEALRRVKYVIEFIEELEKELSMFRSR